MRRPTPLPLAELGHVRVPVSAHLLRIRMRSHASALATPPCAGRVKVGVLRGELMSVLAMRLGGVAGRNRVAAQEVLSSSHRIQVSRVDARTVAAEVVEIEAERDRPDERLVDEPVGDSLALGLRVPDVSVALCRLPCPSPATGFIKVDSRPHRSGEIRNGHRRILCRSTHYGKRFVSVGQKVKRGHAVGLVANWPGDPGRSHTHLGVTSPHGRADATRLIRQVSVAPRVSLPV